MKAHYTCDCKTGVYLIEKEWILCEYQLLYMKLLTSTSASHIAFLGVWPLSRVQINTKSKHYWVLLIFFVQVQSFDEVQEWQSIV